MDRPLHLAVQILTGVGVGVDSGGFDGFCVCARTFGTKSVSYRRPHVANACYFAPGSAGIDIVVAEREAREDVDVRGVVVPCERVEQRSTTEVRAGGGRERGGGGYGCGVVTAAAVGRMGGGGGARRVLVRERGELLAEGVRVRTSEFTPEATREGVKPCKAKLPTELRGREQGAGATWADALRAAVAVTAAWSPWRARAFWLAVVFDDEAGGRWGGGGRKAQRRFRRTHLL